MSSKVEIRQSKKPMPGSPDEVQQEYRKMMRFYNAKEQTRGHIKKKSPNQAFTERVNLGWQSIVCNPTEFSLTFGNDEFRQVRTGGEFTIKDTLYYHETLAMRVGERIAFACPSLMPADEYRFLMTKAKSFVSRAACLLRHARSGRRQRGRAARSCLASRTQSGSC